jgi:hypothetical protein
MSTQHTKSSRASQLQITGKRFDYYWGIYSNCLHATLRFTTFAVCFIALAKEGRKNVTPPVSTTCREPDEYLGDNGDFN